MVRSLRISLILFSITVVGSASQSAWGDMESPASVSELERWNMMLGNWYGDLPSNSGDLKTQVVEQYTEGRFRRTYNTKDKSGNTKRSTEVGYWGISGDVYFTVFLGWVTSSGVKHAIASNLNNYNAYHIITLTDERLEMKHASTGKKYSLKKVPNNFKLPD